MLLRLLTSTLVILMTLVVTFTLGHAQAAGGADPAAFRLNPALMDRMDALSADLKHVPPAAGGGSDGEDGDEDAESVADIARKLDAHPPVRAALARHKLTSTEYATAVLARLHAGMYLATEPGMKPPQRTAALASFTPEQRANIDLVRGRRNKP